MTERVPEREWWSVAEIADAGLPDLPPTRQAIEKMILRQGWRASGQARRRAGRGGGWEYHWSLLPVLARRHILPPLAEAARGAARADRDEAWAWFEGLPAAVQAKARARLDAIRRVEALVAQGEAKAAAVGLVAGSVGASARAVWSWFGLVEGVRPDDRLAHLAPRHRAGAVRRAQAHVDPDFGDLVRSDWLRLARPSLASVWRRASRIAAERQIPVAPEWAVRRWLERTVSRPTEMLLRQGEEALRRLYPPQTRDKTALVPLEVVNADFHKFDVFVQWPQERGDAGPGWIGRPHMVAFQDVFSGRILSWRVDQQPNALAVQLAAGDMIEQFGIPQHILLDNGREFAAKALTGGTPTRYRFKVRQDDVPGLFIALGCEIHWATPYSGQSKPIERAFRDMCDAISKDPRFDGAWTGNKPEAKPEDYGSRAVPLEQFLAVVAEGIEEHNSRPGRRSEVAFGQSFAEAFDTAYAGAPIRKATEAQRRLWLLGAEKLRANSQTGMVKFMGNEFWAPWMGEIAGESLVARFDPADFAAGLHLYSMENAYLGHAPIKVAVGFLTMEEARVHAKARRDWLNAEKAAAAAHKRLTAAELGAALDLAAPPAAPVIRPVFNAPPGGARRRVQAAPTAQEDRAHVATVADLTARLPAEGPADPRTRFRRALDIERAIAAGEPVTEAQQRWALRYAATAEYRAERTVWDDYGDAMFG
jgi:transposase InsO family protein